MSYQLLIGDCRQRLAELPTGSVQTCVTSPPYFGLRDYGMADQIGLEQTPAQFVAELVTVFREVKRVLKDDGTLWLNIGDSYNNFRSQMSPGQSVHGRDKLNGKPAEKSKTRGVEGLKEKDLIGIPWRLAFALQDDGWYLRQDIIWHKPNPMPESVTDRCTKAHEYIFLLSKSPKYYFDNEAIKEKAVGGQTGAATMFKREDSKRAQTIPGQAYGTHRPDREAVSYDADTRNKRSVWTVATKSYAEAHFATYPPELILPCVLAGSRPGDMVLDPFAGSGTTGEVAILNGRKALLLELNPEYGELIKKRCDAAVKRRTALFFDEAPASCDTTGKGQQGFLFGSHQSAAQTIETV